MVFVALVPVLPMVIPACGNVHDGELGDYDVAWFSNDLVGTENEWPMVAAGASFEIWIEIDDCFDDDELALTSSDQHVIDVTATSSDGSGWWCDSTAWGEAVAWNPGTTSIELRHRYDEGDDDDDVTDDDDMADDDTQDDDDSSGDDDDTADEEITDPDDMDLGSVIDSIDVTVSEPGEIALFYGQYRIVDPVALVSGSKVELSTRVRNAFGTDLGFDELTVGWVEPTQQISQLAEGDHVLISAHDEGANNQLQFRFGDIEQLLDVNTVEDIDRLEVVPVRLEERQFVVYVAAATRDGALILDPPYSYEVISGNPSIRKSATQLTIRTKDWTTPVRIRFTAGTAEAHLSLRAEAQSGGNWFEAVSLAQQPQSPSTACALSPGNRTDPITTLILLGLSGGLLARRRAARPHAD